MGMVNHVVPADQSVAKCEQIAAEIIQGVPLAVQKMRVAVMHDLDMPLPDSRGKPEQECFEWLMQSEDSKVGALAFAEKCASNWKTK